MLKESVQVPAYERTFDIVVVGAGLAGLFTAALLSKMGMRVAVIAKGAGVVVASTGFIDVLRRTPAGEPVEDLKATLSQFKTHWPDHPYGRTGWEALAAAENYLAELLSSIGLKYITPCQTANTRALTPLGTLKQTHLLPASAATTETLKKKSVAVISFDGLLDFNPSLVQSNLAGLFPGTKITWALASLPQRKGSYQSGNVKSLTIAREFDDEEQREILIKSLKEAIPWREKPEVVLVPAVLGLKKHFASWQALRKHLGMEVFEVPVLPPSVAGARLFNSLKSVLDTRKVPVNLNCQALSAGAAGGEVKYIDVASEGKIIRYRARYFILATGGLIGGGLIEVNGQLCEPLCYSPLTGAFRLNYQSFVYNAGVAVDDNLRVQGFSNLLACGRILGGYNPYYEGCGNGIALATAMKISTTLEGETGHECGCYSCAGI
ncbi:anaerobic glycerol-3-phosphate dehydrogenase subunit GlpB [Moorella sulfitireducens (nom. illeg.)]|uniref:anaerobic glycerol-3-phosphate dehydrogenase subunit GlpB n=1 Tax=Neomoorella sulfitireducens TaxID=2972948 RepID=UPI0021ABDD94|nr:anaerobic glycerol-3-phosphate dehydrogenase subunit GlpB [Moorella sulfitireducens]